LSPSVLDADLFDYIFGTRIMASRLSAVDDDHVTVGRLKSVADEFVQQRNWQRYHNPKDLAIAISVESAELLDIFKWQDKNKSSWSASSSDRRHIEEEIADVLIYALMFANSTSIDLAGAVFRKMRKNREKYPVGKSSEKNMGSR
jgi:NTP pyrophosphatase (non-canonical NTP hydrolase)